MFYLLHSCFSDFFLLHSRFICHVQISSPTSPPHIRFLPHTCHNIFPPHFGYACQCCHTYVFLPHACHDVFLYILALCLPLSFFCQLPWFHGVQDFLCRITTGSPGIRPTVSVPHSASPHLLNAHLHSQT